MALIDQFNFPDIDQRTAEFLSQDFEVKAQNGVGSYQLKGAAIKSLPYRFFTHIEKMEHLSEELDMEMNKEVPCVQWVKDRDHKPVARVTHLPDQLLRLAKKKVSDVNGIARYEHVLSYFDPMEGVQKEDLESVVKAKGLREKAKYIAKSGLYKEDFDRFQEGLGASGLPLEKWGKASSAEIRTLEAEGIHTVQQLAATDHRRVEGKWPKRFVQLLNEAVHWLNAETKKADIVPFANELMAQKKENESLREALNELQAKMTEMVGTLVPKGRPGRKKKAVVEEPTTTEESSNV